MQHCWGLVGGEVDVDKGEDLREACEREVLEETGLRVSVGKITNVNVIPKVDANGKPLDRTSIVFVFECAVVAGTLRLDDEAEAFGWFEKCPEPSVANFDVPVYEAVKVDEGNYGEKR
jgi:ADP-ribose pyrophosphatase YjhB (NUDIX family)